MEKLRALDFHTAPFAARYFDSDPTGPNSGAVVLLHGTAGSTASHFGLIFPELARDRRVIGLDFQIGTDITVPKLTEQVGELVAGLGLIKPHIVGYSLGAVVAAAFAANHPEQTGQLVLLAGWAATDTQQRLRGELTSRLREIDEDALRTYITLTVFSPDFVA